MTPPDEMTTRLHDHGLLANGRPTLRAYVLGAARKIPYGKRDHGMVAHAYLWDLDKVLELLNQTGVAK